MKKILMMLCLGLMTVAGYAQLNMSSRTGSSVVDKTAYYIVVFEDAQYQLVLSDYFSDQEIILSLGETQHSALASLLQMEEWMKSAKTGAMNAVRQSDKTYNLVKVNGNTMCVSAGDADYCIGAYAVLVPDLKKYSRFISEVADMPHPLGHLTKSDLKRIRQKITK